MPLRSATSYLINFRRCFELETKMKEHIRESWSLRDPSGAPKGEAVEEADCCLWQAFLRLVQPLNRTLGNLASLGRHPTPPTNLFLTVPGVDSFGAGGAVLPIICGRCAPGFPESLARLRPASADVRIPRRCAVRRVLSSTSVGASSWKQNERNTYASLGHSVTPSGPQREKPLRRLIIASGRRFLGLC